MSILSVQNLEMSFGEDILFSGVSFNVEKNDKIALTGQNGAGKTTLLKLISGEYTPDSGGIFMPKFLKLGYMKQQSCENENTVYNELLSVYENLIETEKDLDDISNEIIKNTNDELIKRQEELLRKFNENGGLTYKSMARSALLGLGFSETDFSKSTSTLSGGQKSKLELAKLLLSKADLLLLDEPTNHLDIKSLEWLEKFLSDYNGAFIVVSHDRYFLDKTVSRTIEITNKKIYSYKGNYTQFILKKKAEQKSVEEKYKNDSREVERLEKVIERERQWNREKSIKTAENKEKMLKRIKEQMVLPDSKEEKIRLNFTAKYDSGDDVLLTKDLSKSFNGKIVFQNANIDIKKGQHVFLIGENGAGKTTLLKIIIKKIKADSGNIYFGTNVSVGYFDQIQSELNLQNTVFGEIKDAFPTYSENKIRNALAAFLFKGDDVFRKLIDCSGGERAKVALLKLMLGGYNFLLLDEPTNHLDIYSREVLEDTLMKYNGTMLVVSHDRYFINKIATRIILIDKSEIKQYNGNYNDYIEYQKNKDISDEKTNKKPAKAENEYILKKEKASQIRKLKGQIEREEKKIENLELEVKELQAALESENDYTKLMTISEKLDDKNKEIDSVYQNWEMLSDKLTTINN